MREKIVVEVENVKHFIHNGVLVYNEAKKCWYQVSKEELLKDILKEVQVFEEAVAKDIRELKESEVAFEKKVNSQTSKMLDLIEPLVKK